MNWQRWVLACLFAGSVASAAAANPFVDVTPDDWAYQAVAQLAAEGVIDGYPDGTFQGGRNITRYELAQMVARGLYREESANAEQQELLNRLEREFGSELQNLGVRVTNLEEKVSNVKIGGEVRLGVEAQHQGIDKGSAKENAFDSRLKLRAIATLSKRTLVFSTLKTEYQFGGLSDWQNDATLGKGDGQVEVDTMFGHHTFNGGTLTMGRIPVTLSVTGMFYNDNLDGVALQFGNPKGNHLTLAYGNVQGLNMEFVGSMLQYYDIYDNPKGQFKPESLILEYAYDRPRKFTAKAFYLQPASKTGELVKVYGVGMSYWPHQFVNLHGDYVLNNERNAVNNQKPKFWTAGLSFGIAHPFYPKSFQVGIDYAYTEAGSYFGGAKYDVMHQYLSPVKVFDDKLKNQIRSQLPAPVAAAVINKIQTGHPSGRLPTYYYDMVKDTDFSFDGSGVVKKQNYTFEHGGTEAWLASIKYVPVKRLLLEAFYVFNAKSISGEKMDDGYRIQATYYF